MSPRGIDTTDTPEQEAFRLSPQQRRLWRLMEQRPGNGYRVAGTLRIPGDISTDRLGRALQLVVERHSELVTCVTCLGGGQFPVMVVDNAANPSFATFDDNREHLLISLPPLLGDAKSLAILARDVLALLDGGEMPEAPRYVDVAAWENELLTDADTASLRAFWWESARAVAPDSRLDFGSREPGRAFNTDRVSTALPVPLAQLESLARQLSVTPASLLLAAWHILLQVLSRAEMVTVGTAFDGRSYEGLENGVGLYERYLPLVSNWTPDESFGRFAQLLHSRSEELAAHQEYYTPEAADAEGEFAFLFQSLDLDSPLKLISATTEPFQFRLSATRMGGAVRLDFDYDSGACAERDIKGLVDAYRTLLRWATREPDTQIGRLPILNPAETRKLVAQSAGPRRRCPRSTYHGLFEMQTLRTPSRVAVTQGGLEVTYEELNRSASRLALRLRDAGVEPETVVGIRVERSPQLLAGLLGILKSGGAYLPIDGDLPAQRRDLLLSDANVQVLVSADAESEDGLRVAAPGIPVRKSQRSATAANVAYVLYTSGSSGIPKKVMVTHRNLLHYVTWAAAYYRLAEGSGALVHSPVSFDLTVTSLLAPLIVGQAVHLQPEYATVEDLAAVLSKTRDLSLIKLTPSHLVMLNRILPACDMEGRVRTIVIGGEQLRWDLVAPWLEHAPGTRLINEYGPTEATVGCCVYEIRNPARFDGPVPIGRPIANSRIYLLDRCMRLAPSGVPGEICVAGDGVARGLLNSAVVNGERVYGTGDLGRLRPDGNIEFIGRIDAQIKLSGFRIEPAEIERVLQRSPEVSQARVMARFGCSDAGHLIAYVTGPGKIDTGFLHEECRAALPPYMVPARVIALPKFPLNANGKVDFSGLPEPEDIRGATAPSTVTEAVLARIWGSVLGKRDIGIDTNYFALGGDSIRSLQIVAAARGEGIAFTVADLFQHPTIRDLSRIASSAEPGERASPPGAFELVGDADLERMPPGLEDAYPLTSLQAGMIFHNELEAGASVYHDIFSYRLRLPVSPEHLRMAANLLVREHPALRTTYDLVRFGGPMQLVHTQGAEILEIVDFRDGDDAAQEIKVQAWIEAEKRRGFVLTKLPLVRLQVHLRSERELQLSISFHHAAIDGWSDVSLLTEFFSIYFALLRGEEVRPIAPETQYREFVALERQSIADTPTREFWAKKLEGALCIRLPRLATPSGGELPKTVSLRAVDISQQVSAALKGLALAEAVPVKSLLLAAHLRVISLLSGRMDVLSAMVASGRPERPGAERTLGLFINSIPVRLELSGGSWKDLVGAAFHAERETAPYRRYPLAEIKKLMGGAVSESLFYFTHYHVIDRLPPSDRPEILELIPHESSSFPLVANFWIQPYTGDVKLNLAFQSDVFSPQQMEEIAAYYRRTLEAMANAPEARYEEADLLGEAESHKLLVEWNCTEAPFDSAPIHQQIRARFVEAPDATAAVFGQDRISYAELEKSAQNLARTLIRLGAGRGTRVAILARRGIQMLWGILGTWKTGAAYLPLDPGLPPARREAILRNAGASILLSEAGLFADMNCRDTAICELSAGGDADPGVSVPVDAADPAYVIYTSGSSGEPNGVVVTHGSLSQFLAAMDTLLGPERGVWLAVTSYAFDISILELFWTLARGWTVVIQGGPETYLAISTRDTRRSPMEFSLFYFAAEDSARRAAQYRLLMEGARFADRNAFHAVWTPERHFHDFGGLYPNPAVTAAAIAAVTSRIRIRAGSVVLPLHHPIRVAEEWSVVDNLSNGRAGISFASGWHSRDFILAQSPFEERKALLFRNVEIVRRLWRGETVRFPNSQGQEVDIRICPRPVQPELPVWISAAGDPDTFQTAGKIGANLLTHLLEQNLDELARKILLYREHAREGSRVTLMLHTFVGEDEGRVRDTVREPFLDYMRRSVDLVKVLYGDSGVDCSTIAPDDREELLARAFDRYFVTGGLFGSVDQCLDTVALLRETDVDEVACLIDFGVDPTLVLEGLEKLNEVRRRFALTTPPKEGGDSIAAHIRRHGVTHLQCTPTLAGVLSADRDCASALSGLRALLLGGEGLPEALAKRLAELTSARIVNMYGPTEATIWSTAAEVTGGPITIGRPLANTRIYILDEFGKLAPVGVTGELYIGGLGVAAGYVGDDAMSTARFVPDVWHKPGRCYRTGDLGRYLSDGSIEFLGRNDHQVKIAGHRIEPSEIASVLARHPAVKDCAVVFAEPVGLIAYVVAGLDGEADMRAFLRENLPAPMIPTAFVFLPELPRNTSGKLDRKALPPPETITRNARPALEEPRTPMEREIASIWREVLSNQQIGIHDRLFDLGGHSLQATMIVSRLRDRFRVDFPLRLLFENPTIAGVAVGLAKARQRLSAEISISPGGPENRYRLSFAQTRMWFIEQIAPGSAAYHDVAVLELDGGLDVQALEESLACVVARHESLRTLFLESGGEVFQRAGTASGFHIEKMDISEASAELDVRMRQSAALPFNLQNGPPMRVTLYRVSADQHVLLLVIHHIVCDGWSLNVLIREAAVAYRSRLSREPVNLPPLKLQYKDYAEWQRNHLEGAYLEELLAYWRAQLADAPPVTELPMDHARPPIETFRGRTCRVEIGGDLVQRLEAFSRVSGATLFMTLLAAFDTLVYRHTGCEDVLVGTDVANRNRKEVEPVIGFFVNELVLRCDLSGNPTFRELLARVRETTVAAYDHQDLPFDRLVDELQPTRDLGRNPLYQLAFTLQEAPSTDFDIPGLVLRHRAVHLHTARVDFELNLRRTSDGISGDAKYNDALFEVSTIERMLEHFLNLLEGIAANPDCRIAELDCLSPDERHQLLEAWNRTEVLEGRDYLFQAMFEEQARYRRTAPAISCGERRLTFGELNDEANRVACAIVHEGVGREQVVGVLARRGCDLLAAMLGIFKAGAAYLPLDPEHPPLRQAQILELSVAPVVICDEHHRRALEQAVRLMPEGKRPRQLGLDRLADGAVPRDTAVDYGVDALAYVIFTSGSTGAPKGAMIEHRGMLNHLLAKVAELDLTATDRVAQTAPQCFDISVWQYLAPLLTGASVIVYDDNVARNPRELLRTADADGITVLETVPSLLNLMLDEVERLGDQRPALSTLRWMIVTGEQLASSLCSRWFSAYPSTQMLNAYGPTECSDDVTHCVIRTPESCGTGSVPIGRPIHNTRIYILGPGGHPVPIRTPGELFVGGMGVGRGYLNDAARTDESFVRDPFCADRDARMYRTGDLALYLPNGNIQFLGRADSQIKIAGCRLELGEIETVLTSHPQVTASVVTARENSDGYKQLVAYVVQDQAGSPEALQDEIRRERVAEWRRVYDRVYGAGPADFDADLPAVGWNSSYTGLPIPKEEMYEWLEETVARIRCHRPRHVLEIGCGTGMLLRRIAPHCATYVGTDISEPALSFVRPFLKTAGESLTHVLLVLQPAGDFSGIEPESVDTVILNSVVQYLPNIPHLLEILEGAAQVLAPGGRIFVGDVRDLALLEIFHASVQRHLASPSTPLEEIWRRVQRSIGQEEELTIDPAFFIRLLRHIPKITGVEIQLKGGRSHNELTRFRYDVTLFAGRLPASGSLRILDWREDGLTMEKLQTLLRSESAELVEIRCVPNLRLRADFETWWALKETVPPSEFEPEPGMDPGDVWGLLEELPYDVCVTRCPSGERQCFAIRLVRKTAGESRAWPYSVAAPAAWSDFANNPLHGKFAATLAPKLREYLSSKLPHYMVPTEFVPIPAIPLTRNGKTDYKSLPPPNFSRPSLAEQYAAPRDRREELLAAIWAEVLRLERVGIHDNFFELGGDSIISIQIVARANEAGLRLTPRQAFQHQTIAELAAAATEAVQPNVEQGLVIGPTALLPLQRRFLESEVEEAHHWNQAVMLRLTRRLAADCIEAAFQAVVSHHDGLRLRFHRSAEGWEARIVPPDFTRVLETVDVSGALSHAPAIEGKATAAQRSLHLSDGPLLRAVLFEAGEGHPQHLLILAHHLIIDGVSWRILIQDIEAACTKAAAGAAVVLQRKTTSLPYFAGRLQEYAQSDAVTGSLAFWIGEARSSTDPLFESDSGARAWHASDVEEVRLSTAETHNLFHAAKSIRGVSMEDVVLAAVMHGFSVSEGCAELYVEMEAHGRDLDFEDVDLSRTVGWLAAAYPRRIVWRDQRSFRAQVLDVAQQLRIPHEKVLHWGLLRYSAADAQIRVALSGMPVPPIAFNYFGQLDAALRKGGLFELSQLPCGELRSPRGRREHAIEVDSAIRNGELEIRFTWPGSCPLADRMRRLAELAGDYLRAPGDAILTEENALDFDLAELTGEEWSAAAAEVEFTGEEQ